MLYTVYGLYEAGKPNEIQYVGCTEYHPKERLSQHISARDGYLPVNCWIAKVMNSGKQVRCRILTQTASATIAFAEERELIIQFAKCGPLHNVEGNPNRRTREEYALLREEIRQARANRLEKALADTGEALAVVQAKIADGSLDVSELINQVKSHG